MNKELIICIILVVLIVGCDFITQKYTENTMNYLTNELETLKQGLKESSKNIIDEQVNTINDKWEQVHDKLAYYIEHDELEKVETNFTACKSFTETENYDLAINEVEKMKFILEHITDKYSFNLVNIF